MNPDVGYNQNSGGRAADHMNTPEVIAKKLKDWDGDIMGMCHTEEVYEYRRQLGNGDMMWQCNTKEAREKAVKKIVETNTRNGNGDCMYMCHTPESRSKALQTKLERYGNIFGDLSEEDKRLISLRSKITQGINHINRRLEIVGNDCTPESYFNAINHRVRDELNHIEFICNLMYESPSIKEDPRWTEVMDRIFSWFDKFDNDADLLVNLTSTTI